MRKKLIALVGAGLLLTGCSATSEPEPAATGEVAEATATPEDEFIEAFRSENPNSDRADDETWLGIATAICNALDNGASPNQIIDTMQGDDTDPEEMASLLLLSIEHLCPEHSPS